MANVKLLVQTYFSKFWESKYKTISGYALLGFFMLIAVYHFAYGHKIIPGVYAGEVKLSGKTSQQALEELKQFTEKSDKSINLKIENSEFWINGYDLNLEYDIDATVKRAFEVGRTGNIWIDSKDKFAGLLKRLTIPWTYSVDENALSSEILRIKGEINREAKNAQFTLTTEGTLGISESVDGLKLDGEKMQLNIIESLKNQSFGTKEIPVEVAHPRLNKSDLESLKGTIQNRLDTPLVITYEEREWDTPVEQKLDLLEIIKTDGISNLTMDNTKFEAYADVIAQEVNVLPRGRVSQDEEGRVTSFEITKEGKEIDMKSFETDLEKALLENKEKVVVKTNSISDNKDLSKYGIISLLGEGKSKYTGSAYNRIHNLSLAAERTDGVLVQPGGIYSFSKSVGAISGATGYNSAYVISGNRTVLGEGGGVCQTSTTIFRAILNSGLPIVSRYPHDYRVGYYEIESPVGLDATIFQPSLDLQFKNDTKNYILLQMENRKEDYQLIFRIYGTPDGRKVEMTEPVVTNVTPPPAAEYQDDPNLPWGTIKQVDFPAWGSNVYFTRTVTKENGEELFKDTFSSKYRPWKAIYLRGTKR